MDYGYLTYFIIGTGVWVFIAMLRKAIDGENLSIKLGKKSSRSLKFGEWFGEKGGKIAIIIYGTLILALCIAFGLYFQSSL